MYTQNAVTAVQALSIQSLLNILVSASLLIENISNRFLLQNIEPQAECKDIAELEFSVLSILEVRRFVCQDVDTSVTVLIRKLGCNLPEEVKMWYQIFRISLFIYYYRGSVLTVGNSLMVFARVEATAYAASALVRTRVLSPSILQFAPIVKVIIEVWIRRAQNRLRKLVF